MHHWLRSLPFALMPTAQCTIMPLDPRMELSAYALHEDTALVLCRGHGTRKSPRRLDERGHGYILISVGRRGAPDPRRAIGRKVS
jgi:hypothetical protein